MADGSPALTLARLRELVDTRDVDTVIVSFTDVQGQLRGKRMHARYFLDHVLDYGAQAGTHLLTMDVGLRADSGYETPPAPEASSDVVLRPDLTTLRPAAWLPTSVLVQSDLLWPDGTPVRPSPRQMLLAQLQRAGEHHVSVLAGTEPEFMVFDDGYEAAWDAGYRGLKPSNRYNIDHSILGTGRVEPMLRDMRNTMVASGLAVESVNGQGGHGQYRIGFTSTDALITADNHVVYKTAAKEMATRHSKSVTFMAALNEQAGNSCLVQLSLRGLHDDYPVFATAESGDGRSRTLHQFVSGILATLREFTLLYAPNVNSYKRLQPVPGAPVTVAWSDDSLSCAVRVTGDNATLRVENRVPGGDVNPYLALAAMIAGGLYGVEVNLPREEPLVGQAQAGQRSQLPSTLQQARDLFAGSDIAKSAFGEDVVAHYVNAADAELRAHERAVTDWELRRGFERL